MAIIFGVAMLVVLGMGRLVVQCHMRRGLACLGLLLVIDTCNFLVSWSRSLWANAIAWTVREALLSAMLEIKKSLMMDHTPKRSRGIWNAVQGLQQGLWSGTATVGGYVVDAFGFRTDFWLMSWGFLLNTCVWTLVARYR